MEPLYSYVIVRTDIPLEDQVVQACHASQESGFASQKGDKPVHLVLLQVDNQHKLLDVASKLHLEHKIFFEPDDEMGYTALATLPTQDRRVKVLQRLRLWKPNEGGSRASASRVEGI